MSAKTTPAPSTACLDLITRYEGFSPTPYRCPAGVWTIGYGHTAGVSSSSPAITQQDAAQLLSADLEPLGRAVAAVLHIETTQQEFDALVSFAYNVGISALRGSTLLRELNAGDRIGAAEQFMAWTKAGGRELPGLVRRRAAERALFQGVWA